MLDNTSNNDTFVDGIERRAKKAGAPFNASWARLRCMPHTIHLAAIKVHFLMTCTPVARWLTVSWACSSLKALALFRVQRAGKLLHVLVITKTLPQHRLTATLTMTLQLKTIVKVTRPFMLYQVAVLSSQIDQETFCLP
jgi:hypothetical protein